MAGESGISFIETYRCPHCQAALEARTGRLSPWLRCPSCGRAGRVPDRAVVAAPRAAEVPGDDTVFIDDRAALTPVAAWSFKAPARSNRPGSALRVVYAASLFVAVTLLLFMLLERNTYGITVCIGVAIISLGLLVRSSRW